MPSYRWVNGREYVRVRVQYVCDSPGKPVLVSTVHELLWYPVEAAPARYHRPERQTRDAQWRQPWT